MTPAQADLSCMLSAEYLVYFLGFVPGFAYLGELSEALGDAAACGGRGEGCRAGQAWGSLVIRPVWYPFATPGGWRLLGRTPMAMFRTDRDELRPFVHWRPRAFYPDFRGAICGLLEKEWAVISSARARAFSRPCKTWGEKVSAPWGVSASGGGGCDFRSGWGNRLVGNAEGAGRVGNDAARRDISVSRGRCHSAGGL